MSNDLVVIGSGIVGLNSAISFKSRYPKSNVLVIERGVLPYGASTKNAGFACFGSVSELVNDLKSMSESGVWETVELRYKGLLKLRSLLGDKAIDYKSYGGYEVFNKKVTFERYATFIEPFNKRIKEIVGKGKIYKVNSKKIKGSGFRGFSHCIENAAEGQIDTGKMMESLLGLAREKGIKILNGIDIKSIGDTGEEVELTTKDNFSFKAKKVIVATNGFARELLKKEDVKPARAQVLVTSPIRDLKIKGAFHYEEGFYYFRNINDRVLFGGGRNLDLRAEETSEFGLTRKIQQKLEELLRENILPGQKYTIEYRWSGIMGVGSEKKPIIRHVSPNTVCAVRMGGMGVAIGSMVGELAVKELIKGS
ncbi:MAG: NAD(P)/FAD-dependent oxidoreductase [Bacteroidia bacterium]